MKTDVVTPHEVFFNPTRLVVPLFQRPYVWSRDVQWKPLWEDVARLIEVIQKHQQDATHFLGAIVVQSVPSTLGGLPTWNVIDGQQRLTTLQVLLDALHGELVRRGWPTLADQVHSLVENPAAYCETADDKFKVWPTNRDRSSFTAVMSAAPDAQYKELPQSRLVDAHQFFATQISKWLDEDGDPERRARVLVPTVTQRLEIASIRLESTEDAQEIFETLNARGTPLTAADLIKNFIFQKLNVSDAESEASYRKHWADFETPFWEEVVRAGRVTHPRSTLFLWQWLVARTLEDFPIREVFTQFKFFVAKQGSDIAGLLPQIKAAADKYRLHIEQAKVKTGQLSRTDLFIYRVGTLDSEIVRSLLIWLDEPEQSGVADADRDALIAVLESWFVRRALVRAPSQGSNRFMVDLLQHLSAQPKDNLAHAATVYLAGIHSNVGYWPGDEEVRVALIEAPAYTRYLKGRLRMVLEALEDYERGYPDGKKLSLGPVPRDIATIEHLMPQGWQKHWPADLDDEQEAIRNNRVQQLGNLTLVTQALNSKVSNAAWSEKVKYFAKHDDTMLTRGAVDLGGGEWDEEKIQQRTSSMVEQILQVWRAPSGHIGSKSIKVPPPTRAAVEQVAVDMAQLVADGWLEAGTALRGRPGAYSSVTAQVAQDGRVFIGDVGYDTPSAAAMSLTIKNQNGWVFWVLDSDAKTTLAELRSLYLESIGEDEAAAQESAASSTADADE